MGLRFWLDLTRGLLRTTVLGLVGLGLGLPGLVVGRGLLGLGLCVLGTGGLVDEMKGGCSSISSISSMNSGSLSKTESKVVL